MQNILPIRIIFGWMLIFTAQTSELWAQPPDFEGYDSLKLQFEQARIFDQKMTILNTLSKLSTLSNDSLAERKRFQEFARFAQQNASQLPENEWEKKYNLYRNAGRLYQKCFAYDSAIFMFESANQMAYQQHDSVKAQYCLTEMGHYAKSAGKIAAAEKYYRQALKIAKHYQQKVYIAEIEEYLGDIYSVFGMYDKAIAYYDSALAFRKTSPSNELVLLQNRIGELYLKWNQDSTANQFLRQALELAFRNQFELGEAYILRNLGSLHEKQGKNDSALVNYERAHAKFHKFQQTKEEILCHIYRGNIYIKTKKFERAELFFRYAIHYAGQNNERYLEAKAYEGAARNFMAMQQYPAAMKAAQFSQKIALNDGYSDIVRDNFLNMSKIYEHNENYKTALEHYQSYIWTKDKIFNEINASKLAGMRASVEVSQAQEENKALKIQQQMQETQLKIIGIILVFVIVLMAVVFYVLSQRNQALKKLKTQNKQIDKQYKIIAKEKQNTDKAYEQLQCSQAQLLHSEKMASLGQLTAGVAHEFNNPINFIYSASETLENDLKQLVEIYEQQSDLQKITDKKLYQEKLKHLQKRKAETLFEELPNDIFEALDDIRHGAERLTEIVQGLRIFSRLDQNTPKPIDLHENLNATLTMLKNMLQTIEIQKVYAENIPQIQCIPGEINQVFLNVLTNAIQAIPEPKTGKIQIITALDSEQNQVQITITDNGIGMDSNVLNRIFEPFFTTRKVGEGTGVGLFTAYQIIKKHHGQIVAHSQPNEGAIFMISLPLSIMFEK